MFFPNIEDIPLDPINVPGLGSSLVNLISASLSVVAQIWIHESLATPDLTCPPGSKYKKTPHFLPPKPSDGAIVNSFKFKLSIVNIAFGCPLLHVQENNSIFSEIIIISFPFHSSTGAA